MFSHIGKSIIKTVLFYTYQKFQRQTSARFHNSTKLLLAEWVFPHMCKLVVKRVCIPTICKLIVKRMRIPTTCELVGKRVRIPTHLQISSQKSAYSHTSANK